jgi:hypothetical protein
MRDYYRILGIRSDATRDEIKEAWNFSVKAFHPDKFASSSESQQKIAQERTKAINEAYEVLSNPVRRANYDLQYSRKHSPHATAPPRPSAAQRTANTASSRQRTRATAPRKAAFAFRPTVEFLKSCVSKFKTSVANLTSKLSAGVIGTAKFFASLVTKMLKASAAAFYWFYRKRKSLTAGVALLLFGISLGIYLSSNRHTSWDELRGVLPKMASFSSTTFARLWRNPAKPMIPSSSPTPNALTLELSSPNLSLVDQLLAEGRKFRERGDVTNALARFQEALDSEPDNTGVLQEMAETYESMQLFDRANDVWRRIKQIAPSNSATYALADHRLKVGVPVPPTLEPSGGPAEADLSSLKDIGGNPDGPIMGISRVETKETSDHPEVETNLALQIGIKKEPGAVIDHNEVKVLVWLYDIVNDKDIVITDANVSNEWLTARHDWSDTNPEVLLVRYVRAKTGGALSESSLSESTAKGSANIGRRKYLGYIVQVYYGEDLQAVQAEPARLLQQFPVFTSQHDSTAADQKVIGASPNSTPSEFVNYARKLREKDIEQIPPLSEPTDSQSRIPRYPWKNNIVTTVFWVGEKQSLGKMSPTHQSVWDKHWEKNYGGVDNPDASGRRNYLPVAFIPRQNPFYCALPYDDVAHSQFKPEAPAVIPWFKQAYSGQGQSVCRHRWIAVRKGNRVCYAQWEDCGPFSTDHFQYVFGNERPKPNANHGAGLSVSPAVRDYLGLAPTDVTDWQFVEVRDVPPGPWRSYGENNHFVIARRQAEQRISDQKGNEKVSNEQNPKPSVTPVDTDTIKRWVNDAERRGEEWGKEP